MIRDAAERELTLFEMFDKFCSKINFAQSALDNEAIVYMDTLFKKLRVISVQPEEQGQKDLVKDLEELLFEARNGEFGDFTNRKYVAPKVELVGKLNMLRENVVNGRYD